MAEWFLRSHLHSHSTSAGMSPTAIAVTNTKGNRAKRLSRDVPSKSETPEPQGTTPALFTARPRRPQSATPAYKITGPTDGVRNLPDIGGRAGYSSSNLPVFRTKNADNSKTVLEPLPDNIEKIRQMAQRAVDSGAVQRKPKVPRVNRKPKEAAEGEDGVGKAARALQKRIDPRIAQRLENKKKVKSRLPVSVHRGGREASFGMTEAEYMMVKETFERLDEDGSGELSWEELTELSGTLGTQVDQVMFKRMDRDRSGRVDFIEMLRCLFPTCNTRDIHRATKKWGLPRGREEAVDEESMDWRSKYDEKALSELTCIFHLYKAKAGAPDQKEASRNLTGATEAPPLDDKGLSLAELRAAIPRNAVADDIIEEIFTAHDRDGNAELSLEEFAGIMEDIYLKESNRSPEVRLYFQTPG